MRGSYDDPELERERPLFTGDMSIIIEPESDATDFDLDLDLERDFDFVLERDRDFDFRLPLCSDNFSSSESFDFVGERGGSELRDSTDLERDLRIIVWPSSQALFDFVINETSVK